MKREGVGSSKPAVLACGRWINTIANDELETEGNLAPP
jgi:hypothetical protein